MALLPFVQLPHSVGVWAAKIRAQPEVAEAVLGILILSKPGRGRAMARSYWQGPVRIYRCGQLVADWWSTAWECVLSRPVTQNKRSLNTCANARILALA